MTELTKFTYLWRGLSEGQRSRSSRIEGQGHKKATKIAFLHNSYGKILTHGALWGHVTVQRSKVKVT